MDTRLDAAQPRVSVAAPTPAPPRPAEAPWARAWAQEWQQAAGTKDSPAAGDVRVAWRDASASSTWLAPVRARVEQRPDGGPPPPAPPPGNEAGRAPAPPAADHTEASPGDTAASPALLFVPAAQQVPMARPAVPSGPDQAQPAGAEWASPVAEWASPVALAAMRTTPAGLGATAALPAAGSPGPAASGQATRMAAPRTTPPSRAGEARPYAATNLQVTPGDDGPAVWLRDARLSPDGQATAHVLQALAALGWPHTLRPGTLFLNGRPLGPASTARALPPQDPPHTLNNPPKEDPHGH